jgi:K+-transporting ATPase A subunit
MKCILFLLILAMAGCTSVHVYNPKQLSEDSINWEYDTVRSFNTNNNQLDSPDGSVQKGSGIKFFKATY